MLSDWMKVILDSDAVIISWRSALQLTSKSSASQHVS